MRFRFIRVFLVYIFYNTFISVLFQETTCGLRLKLRIDFFRVENGDCIWVHQEAKIFIISTLKYATSRIILLSLRQLSSKHFPELLNLVLDYNG